MGQSRALYDHDQAWTAHRGTGQPARPRWMRFRDEHDNGDGMVAASRSSAQDVLDAQAPTSSMPSFPSRGAN
jgi:uncharacterized membrane protein YcjF (UPF0283 family)